MSAIKINGIRVGHQMYHLRQYPENKDSQQTAVLYQSLAKDEINLPCLGLERTALGYTVSCCLEGEVPEGQVSRPVCMISVYPHGSKLATLGFLLSLFGQHKIQFLYMVSSNAMVTFVVDQEDKAAVLSMLETTFDLPPTHTPYEPGFHEETAAFVKKRYQETRAYFQEERIKTYGFALEKELPMTGIRCKAEQLEKVGKQIGELGTSFYFALAFGHEDSDTFDFYGLTDKDCASQEINFSGLESFRKQVDLVSFHGPHFGDRFGIFNAAATCLDNAGLDLQLAGCTGASVGLVLPAGSGTPAIPALEKGFEKP